MQDHREPESDASSRVDGTSPRAADLAGVTARVAAVRLDDATHGIAIAGASTGPIATPTSDGQGEGGGASGGGGAADGQGDKAKVSRRVSKGVKASEGAVKAAGGACVGGGSASGGGHTPLAPLASPALVATGGGGGDAEGGSAVPTIVRQASADGTGPRRRDVTEGKRQWLLVRQAFGLFEEHATQDTIALLQAEFGNDWLLKAVSAPSRQFGERMLQNRLRAACAAARAIGKEAAVGGGAAGVVTVALDVAALKVHLRAHEPALHRAVASFACTEEVLNAAIAATDTPCATWDVYVLTEVLRAHGMPALGEKQAALDLLNDLADVRHVVAHRFPTPNECRESLRRVVRFCDRFRVGSGCVSRVQDLLRCSLAEGSPITVSATEWASLRLFSALHEFKGVVLGKARQEREVAAAKLRKRVEEATRYPEDAKRQKQILTARKEWDKAVEITKAVLGGAHADPDHALRPVAADGAAGGASLHSEDGIEDDDVDLQDLLQWLRLDPIRPFLKAHFGVKTGDKAVWTLVVGKSGDVEDKGHLGRLAACRNVLSHQIALTQPATLRSHLDAAVDALEFFGLSSVAQRLQGISFGADVLVGAAMCVAGPPKIRVLPPDVFVDRKQQATASLAALCGALERDGCVVVIGPPGVGKSELGRAVLHACDAELKYTVRGATLRGDLLALANHHMGIKGDGDEALGAFKNKLMASAEQWVLIVDDAHEAAAHDMQWLPAGDGRMLVLSRRSVSVASKRDAVVLKPFGTAESLELIRQELNRKEKDKDKVTDALIAETTGDRYVDSDAAVHGQRFLQRKLDNLPLAVSLFAKAVSNTRGKLGKVGSAQDTARAALRQAMDDFDSCDQAFPDVSLKRSCGVGPLCHMALRGAPAETLALASILAVLSPTMTPKFLFEMDGKLPMDVAKMPWAKVLTRAGLGTALGPLLRAHMVKVETAEPPDIAFPRFMMHALVQGEVRVLVKEIDACLQRDACEALRRVLKVVYLDLDVDECRGDRERFLSLEQLTPCISEFHKRGVVSGDGKFGARERSNWAFQLARVQQERCAYRASLAHYEECLTLKKNGYGHKHPDVAATLGNMGTVYRAQGDYPRALEKFEEILAIFTAVHGGHDHPDVAATLGNMALVYAAQGNFAKALEMHEEELKIEMHFKGHEHPDVARTLGNISNVHQAQGNYPEALRVMEGARTIFEKCVGHDHPDVSATLCNMGIVYRAQGDNAKALKVYEESLAIDVKVHGRHDHPDVAATLHNITSALDDQGDYTGALAKYDEALKILVASFGHDHPSVSATLCNMGVVYNAQGDYTKALEMYEQALAIDTKVHGGHEHRDVAATLVNMANVFQQQGNYDAALLKHEEGLKILIAVHGHEHPDVARTLQNMGNVYQSQGDYAKALDHQQRAHDVYVKAYGGHEHPDVARTLGNIAIVHKAQGNYPEALKVFEEVRTIFETCVGHKHPDVARTLQNMGNVYQSQGDYAKALDHQQRAHDVYVKAYGGHEHPDVAATLVNKADVLIEMGDYDAAAPLAAEALATMVAKHSRTHAACAHPHDCLGRIAFLHRNDFVTAEEHLEASRRIRTEHVGGAHPDVAKSLLFLGECATRQGDTVAGVEKLERALEILGKAHQTDMHPDAAKVHIALALAHPAGSAERVQHATHAVAVLEHAFSPSHTEGGLASTTVHPHLARARALLAVDPEATA